MSTEKLFSLNLKLQFMQTYPVGQQKSN